MSVFDLGLVLVGVFGAAIGTGLLADSPWVPERVAGWLDVVTEMFIVLGALVLVGGAMVALGRFVGLV